MTERCLICHRELTCLHCRAVQVGQLGGQAKSPAKLRSSRKNGKKGGRPKKQV